MNHRRIEIGIFFHDEFTISQTIIILSLLDFLQWILIVNVVNGFATFAIHNLVYIIVGGSCINVNYICVGWQLRAIICFDVSSVGNDYGRKCCVWYN